MSGVASGFDPTKKPKQREFKVEDYLKKEVEAIGGKCYKWVSPGYDGVPDRIVIFKGCVVFVETKRPGKKPRKLQTLRLEELKKQGMCVSVADNKQDVNSIVAYLATKGLKDDRL